MSRYLLGFVVVLIGGSAGACIWDGDTLRDEAVANPSWFDILIGQFAHHGTPYYEHRIERLTAKETLSQAERNDLGVAYLRVEKFEEAEAIFLALLEGEPDYYPAISNLGVLKKKMGEYQAAHDYIKQALAINPEGHLGIGDWYLRMLAWRVKGGEGVEPGENFLRGWTEEEAQKREEAMYITSLDIDRLFLLVKNDQTFADGFYVLGEELYQRRDFNLAYIAFFRARELNHPEASGIEGRLSELANRGVRRAEYIVPRLRVSEDLVRGMLDGAAAWREEYSQLESELLARGIEPTFAVMETETDIHSRKSAPLIPTFWESLRMYPRGGLAAILIFVLAALLITFFIGLYLWQFRRTERGFGVEVAGAESGGDL